jgi:hypothetical protein
LAGLRDFEDSATAVMGSDGELLAHESSAATSGWRRAGCTTTLDAGLKAIRHLDVSR